MSKNIYKFFVLFILPWTVFGQTSDFIYQQPIEFRNSVVENHYPDGIQFYVEICGLPPDADVVLSTKTYRNWDEFWWDEFDDIEDEGYITDGCRLKSFRLRKEELGVPPFSPVKYQWLVRKDSKTFLVSNEYVHYYKNDNFRWISRSSGPVTIWWHDMPETFGAKLLSIAEQAIHDQASYFGTALDQPVTIVIFNTQSELADWQTHFDGGFGGIAFSPTMLTAQVVGYGDYEWAGEVIPHELSHLYFYQIGKVQPWISPWLNEGFAVYNEYSNHLGEWSVMQEAYASDSLVPFKLLDFTFNDYPDRRRLDYAQSYYSILFMEETYGHDKVLELIDVYSQGYNLDNSLKKVFGINLSGFEVEFKEWLPQRLKSPPPDSSVIIKPIVTKSDGIPANLLLFGVAGTMCMFMLLGLIWFVILWFLNDSRSTT